MPDSRDGSDGKGDASTMRARRVTDEEKREQAKVRRERAKQLRDLGGRALTFWTESELALAVTQIAPNDTSEQRLVATQLVAPKELRVCKIIENLKKEYGRFKWMAHFCKMYHDGEIGQLLAEDED